MCVCVWGGGGGACVFVCGMCMCALLGVLLLSGSRKLIRQQVAIAVRKAGRATTFYDDSAVPAHVIRQLEEVNTYDMQLYRVAVSHFQKQLRVGSSTCRVPLATA